ncbi:hypothetical protein CYMTET_32735, partial [Cymbomonas tetramitiformis]
FPNGSAVHSFTNNRPHNSFPNGSAVHSFTDNRPHNRNTRDQGRRSAVDPPLPPVPPQPEGDLQQTLVQKRQLGAAMAEQLNKPNSEIDSTMKGCEGLEPHMQSSCAGCPRVPV